MPKIVRQPNGVWSCKVQVRGTRHYLKSKDRKKVVKRLGEILAEKNAPAASTDSFEKVALLFLKHKEAVASPGGFRHYEHHTLKPGGMVDYFGERAYADVALPDYQKFLDHRRTTPSRRHKAEPRLLSAQTVEHERAILVQIALFAEDRAIVQRAPITSRSLKRQKVPAAEPRMFSDSELVAVLEESGEDMRRLLLLFLHTGLRLAEMQRMTWEGIDLTAKTLTVGGKGSKSKHSDTIPLDATALEILDALPCKTGPVIAGNWGDILEGQSAAKIYAELRKIASALGIKRFGLHAFRHALGVSTLRATKSRYVTEKMLRHRDPKQMERYARLVPDEIREDVARVDAHFAGLGKVVSLAARRAKKKRKASGP